MQRPLQIGQGPGRISAQEFGPRPLPGDRCQTRFQFQGTSLIRDRTRQVEQRLFGRAAVTEGHGQFGIQPDRSIQVRQRFFGVAVGALGFRPVHEGGCGLRRKLDATGEILDSSGEITRLPLGLPRDLVGPAISQTQGQRLPAICDRSGPVSLVGQGRRPIPISL